MRARAGRMALLGLGLAVAGWTASAAKWDPIDPADLAATDSPWSPGADVEILFERHELEGAGWLTAETEAYIRAKIYTLKGVEDHGRLEIPSYGDSAVSGVVARVVKPDGTSHDLKKEDIHRSTVWKSAHLKSKVTRLAFPNLAPGDIVEYKWRHAGQGMSYVRWLYVQRTVPVREFRLRLVNIPENFVGWPNCPNMEENRRGGYTLTARHVAPFVEEEFMPPDREFRGWLFMVRTFGEKKHDRMWRDVSEWSADDFGRLMSPSGAVKQLAKSLTADATTDEEKLRRLYEFCQAEITNFSWIDTPEVQKERERTRTTDTQTSGATLSRKYGWREEVNILFAGLARAAGYEVRKCYNAAIDDLLNIRTPRGWAFLNRSRVAVKVGEEWRFFDPGSYFVPHSMLDWRDEGATAMLCGENDKEVVFREIPRSPAAASRAVRRGRFVLSEDGTLEGDVEISWTGHLARVRKGGSWGDSQEDVDKDFREELNKRLPQAEISDIVWENLRTRDLPLVVRFRVSVPGYADSVGTRLVVRPGFFEAGRPVIFAAPTRRYPIAFPFCWQESDEISIQLPEGYELDQPSAPRNIGGDSNFQAAFTIRFLPRSRTLRYSREFSLGGDGVTMFQAQSYPVLKALFEGLHRSDSHALMVRPKTIDDGGQNASSTTAAP